MSTCLYLDTARLGQMCPEAKHSGPTVISRGEEAVFSAGFLR
jgi:hypothetical protein